MKQYVKPLVITLIAGGACAQASEFRSLTQQCEEALALSALPVALRDRANVYVWRDGDFEQTISSDGGFDCVVQRNHPDSIIPECVSSTGKDSMFAGIVAQTKLTASGMSLEEVTDEFEKMVESGEVPGPTEPGVNYMMSDYNYIYTSNSGRISHIPPHTMFFAPDATNEIVGGSFQAALETPGLPFVAEAGSHSYIITFTASGSDSADVEQHCAGQLENPSTTR